MITIEILVTEWEKGQVSAGTITVVKGKLKASPTEGYERMLQSFIEEQDDDPESYLKSLPKKYNGNMLRVKILD